MLVPTPEMVYVYYYVINICIVLLLFDFLERILRRIVFSQHNLLLLLGSDMLDPHLLCQFTRKLADETRIPEFACNTEIFTAAHKGVGFAAFGGGGNAIGVEVLLFATSY